MSNPKKLKIGIVTNYMGQNYGSVLQSYALQEKLFSYGFEAENIRYNYGRYTSIYKRALRILKDKLRIILKRNAQSTKTQLFRRKYINESKLVYNTINDLKTTNNIYNFFICGSDQIWAPNQFNEWYYLSFANDKKLKIAYAPSIGLPEIPMHLQKNMASLISRLDYISIREKQGADIINELTGVLPEVVLDPTLLLNDDDWRELAVNPSINTNYALCYFLGDHPEYIKLAKEYCIKHNLTLISPVKNNNNLEFFDVVLNDVGPKEFLGLIANADVIFTDSFHGTAFSINFKKLFYTFLRFNPSDELCQNSRIFHVLETFGLEAQLVKGMDDVEELQKCEIDYKKVNNMLNNLRNDSEGFLRGALGLQQDS